MADLPDTYDLIVVGTGMPECIVAAAASRAGKSVLHLDRNNHYGGHWASFNLEFLMRWINKHQETSNEPLQRLLEANWLEQLNDDEHLVICPKHEAIASDVQQKSYIPEHNEPLADQGDSVHPNGVQHDEEANIENDYEANVDDVHEQADDNGVDPQANVGDEQNATDNVDQSSNAGNDQSNVIDEPQHSVEQQSEECPCETEENVSDPEQVAEVQAEAVEQVLPNNSSEPSESMSNADQEELQSGNEEQESSHDIPNDHQEEQAIPSIEITGPTDRLQEEARNWTMETLLQNRNKFNIDLSPKILFSRGSLVELLISSNTARYADFQSVNRILTLINGHLEQVPCSRADVFSTKNVTVVEKRMLMKLLTFCLEYQKYPEEYRGYEGRPFIEFLRSRKITPNIEHYILHAIAMVDESCLTLQGLQATQKFMESLGRFGNSPFLWTCYGSAELPQCFCRLCAVFGGIYYLGRDADALIIDSNNHCAGIISQGKKLKCPSVVMEYSYAPLQYYPQGELTKISRAIYITDSSILPSERQQNTFLRLPPVAGKRNATIVLEFGSLSYICPRDLFVVHMTCETFGASPAEDFQLAEEELFKPLEDSSEESNSDNEKPKVLWRLHFRHPDVTSFELNSGLPSGVFLTSTPGLELDYEHAVKEAREIFEKLYPGEEFLPRAPDPEDIVLEEHSNPGDEADNYPDMSEACDSESKMIEGDTEEKEVADIENESAKSSHNEVIEAGVEAIEDGMQIR